MRVVEQGDRDTHGPWCRDCLAWYWHRPDCKIGALPPVRIEIRCPNCGTVVSKEP